MRPNRFQRPLWNLLLIGWLVMACTAPEDKAPEDLIPAEQMADMLTEVHMAESRISRLGLHAIDSSNIAYKHLESQIFKKFQVDTARYRRSYFFYSSHPADMEAIYKNVVDKLQKKTRQKPSKPKTTLPKTTLPKAIQLKQPHRS